MWKYNWSCNNSFILTVSMLSNNLLPLVLRALVWQGGELTGGRYNAGKSQFYTAADSEAHARISQLTPVKAPPSIPDNTLYLSNSTFYEDMSQRCRGTGCPFFGNPATLDLCSKCYQDIVEEPK